MHVRYSLNAICFSSLGGLVNVAAPQLPGRIKVNWSQGATSKSLLQNSCAGLSATLEKLWQRSLPSSGRSPAVLTFNTVPVRYLASHSCPSSARRSHMTKAGRYMEQLAEEQQPVKTAPALSTRDVGGYMTDVLELMSTDNGGDLNVIVVPGNPGVVRYYWEFIRSMSEEFGGRANIYVIAHVGHTEKNWEKGRVFSLQQQIDHKISFVDDLLRSSSLPVVVVGHSIGAHVGLQVLRAFPQQVKHMVGLYPFLDINTRSREQKMLNMLSHIAPLRIVLGLLGALIGALPLFLRRPTVRLLIGRNWAPEAVDVTARVLMQYSVMDNYAFMGSTEFDAFAHDGMDWAFLEDSQSKVSLIFGEDDHWGPTHLEEEIQERLPGLRTMVEKEGHLHAFCCTTEGSRWVAKATVKEILERQRSF